MQVSSWDFAAMLRQAAFSVCVIKQVEYKPRTADGELSHSILPKIKDKLKKAKSNHGETLISDDLD